VSRRRRERQRERQRLEGRAAHDEIQAFVAGGRHWLMAARVHPAGLQRLLDLQAETHAAGKTFAVAAKASRRPGMFLALVALPKAEFKAIDLAVIFGSDAWEEERLATLPPGQDFALVGAPGWGPHEYTALRDEVVAALAG